LLARFQKLLDDDTKYPEFLLYPVSGHPGTPLAAIFEVREKHMNRNKLLLFVGSAVVVAGGLIYVLGIYPPAAGRDGQGAIGERKVYRAEQPADAAVNPGAAPVAMQATVEMMKNHQIPELQNGMVFQLKSGEMYQLNNGQLMALQNGFVFNLKNGQMLQLQNGQLYELHSGQLLAIKNEMRYQMQSGQMLQIQNGQLLALKSGQMFQLSNGQLFQLNNGQLFQLNNNMLYQLNSGQIQAAMRF